MAGTPAATAGGGASGVAPNAADSGLTVGVIAVQLGGTANAPIAAPRPTAAAASPPSPPMAAAGAVTALPIPSAAAAAPAAASPVTSEAAPALPSPTKSDMVPRKFPGM